MAKRRLSAPSSPERGGDPADVPPIRELDRVRLLSAATGDDAQPVPVGATGTVVGIYAAGEAFEVEFARPVDTLATVDGQALVLVEPFKPLPSQDVLRTVLSDALAEGEASGEPEPFDMEAFLKAKRDAGA